MRRVNRRTSKSSLKTEEEFSRFLILRQRKCSSKFGLKTLNIQNLIRMNKKCHLKLRLHPSDQKVEEGTCCCFLGYLRGEAGVCHWNLFFTVWKLSSRFNTLIKAPSTPLGNHTRLNHGPSPFSAISTILPSDGLGMGHPQACCLDR